MYSNPHLVLVPLLLMHDTVVCWNRERAKISCPLLLSPRRPPPRRLLVFIRKAFLCSFPSPFILALFNVKFYLRRTQLHAPLLPLLFDVLKILSDFTTKALDTLNPGPE